VIPLWPFLLAALQDAPRDEGAQARPRIIANPSTDAAFLEHIDRYLASGGRRPEDLQTALRSAYPQAVVRRRSLAGERIEIWYVYRDGHWVAVEKA
jgi:hypothetical protein